MNPDRVKLFYAFCISVVFGALALILYMHFVVVPEIDARESAYNARCEALGGKVVGRERLCIKGEILSIGK